MKVRKVALKMKDLHNGRVFYWSEPGSAVLKCKVFGRKHESINCSGFSYGSGQFDPKEHTASLPYVLAEGEVAQRVLDRLNPENKEAIDWLMEHDYTFANVFIGIEFINSDVETQFIQEHMFNPSETHMRAFKKRKQALRYSQLPVPSEELDTLFE